MRQSTGAFLRFEFMTVSLCRAPLPLAFPSSGEIDLDVVEKTPLAGEGNYLYRIPWGDSYVVAKIYHGSRSRLLYAKKTFGNVVLTGRSSHMPVARCRTELDCIETWERHGFRCFRTLPDITIRGLPRDGYMVFEYVPGVHFKHYFKDPSIPLAERMETWSRWVLEWHRRHRAAVEHDDGRLIHENGDVKHVMLWDDDWVYFDFEMVYTSRDVRMLVGRELLAYMRSVGRFFGPDLYDRMLDELVRVYPDRSLLMAGWEFAFHHSNPLTRALRAVDRRVKPSHRKRFSKYRVALDLRRRLDGASLS